MTAMENEATTRWCVEVRPRSAASDGHGREVLADVHQLGLEHIRAVRSSKVYFFQGALTLDELVGLATDLLTDPVAESHECRAGFATRDGAAAAIEVHVKPGVTNPVAVSTLHAARRLLAARGHAENSIAEVQTARRYEVLGADSVSDLRLIAEKVLANDCIETAYIQGFDRRDAIPETFAVPPDRGFELRHVRLSGLSDAQLAHLSRNDHLFLSLEEMRAIRDYFDTLRRDPTDLEIETLAQTWSEHCVHKTLKSEIHYRGEDFGATGHVEVHFDNLLADTIVRATKTLDRDWCLSVFVDNAGVIAFDEEYGIAFKVETHNHPSAIEPYGGAATGIGGVIRDILGCGLGAKPIASTDIFCFAPPDFDAARLPKDVLHPRRILKGVVRGVRDYGNRMGIPTVNGAIYFHEGYLANPLVFCGSVGLIPRDRIAKEARPGDRIVVAGGRTGRDGIHGATFSSAELTDTHADEFSHAVQIGNAIEEKKVLDALLIARDHAGGCLYSAVTDCGAGGLSSAVGEMGEAIGAVVELKDVPLKYAGLRYDEIWISEAQERMVFAVPPEKLQTLLKVFEDEEVEATVIGEFTSDKILTVRYRGETVGRLDMDFLHHGLPKRVREATWTAPEKTSGAAPDESNESLLRELRGYNVASKEWVIRQYDHEVQGRSVVKPLVGPRFGPSDAAVLRPRYDRPGGIALGCGLCPEPTEGDPYAMAIAAVDEALRNVICVGGDPLRTAILDNFCWGQCDTPETLGGLVRASKGAADAAIAYGLPFISGKDSLNNYFTQSDQDAQRLGLPARISIPGTLLISALSIVNDVSKCVTMDLKEAGNHLVVASAPVDRVGLKAAYGLHKKVADLIAAGKVRSAHDVSDGGLAVTLAEMSIASGLTATVELDPSSYPDPMLTPLATSYVLEMAPRDAAECGLPVLGAVEPLADLTISRDGEEVVRLSVEAMAEAWRRPLAKGGAA
jgi:phosphoribosylformylglycinamidine synthase II